MKTTTKAAEAAKKPKAKKAGKNGVPGDAAPKLDLKLEQETVQTFPLEKCHISVRNTRQPNPKDPAILELAKSMRERAAAGQRPQTTPGIARPHPDKPGELEIAAGARRRTALGVAGVATFDVVVREMDDSAFDELILIENLQREDPDPRAEATLLETLVARGVATAEAISAHLGKPKHWVIRRMSLLKLTPALRKQWEKGNMTHFSVEMMEQLGALAPDTQDGLVKHHNHPLFRCDSPAELRKYLEAQVACDLSKAPFDLHDERFFVKGCGPGCATDTAKTPGLLDLGTAKDAKCGRCVNTGCFMARLAKWRAAEYEKLCDGKSLPLLRDADDYHGESRIKLGDTLREVPRLDYGTKHSATPPKDVPTEKLQKFILVKGNTLAVRYLLPEPKDRSGGGGSKKVVSPAEKEKGKRDTLQGKRWQLVHKDLTEALAKATHDTVQKLHPKHPEILTDLVCVFGLPWSRDPDRYHSREVQPNRLWKRFDDRKDGFNTDDTAYKPVMVKTREECLWAGLQRVLKKQLGPIRLVTDVLHVVPDMERIAKLIGYDLAKRKLAADLEVLPPKSWGPTDPHTLQPMTAAASMASANAKIEAALKAHNDTNAGIKKDADKARSKGSKPAARKNAGAVAELAVRASMNKKKK